MAMPVFAAGQVLTGALLNQLSTQIDSLTAPSWTAYTPVWTGSTTNPVIGNGTISGRYRRPTNSDKLDLEIRVVMGSTTTYGSGFWIFSLPFNASASAVNNAVGSAIYLDVGTLDRSGEARFNSATQLILDHPTLGVVTPTVPHTWASTDILQVSISYEPA